MSGSWRRGRSPPSAPGSGSWSDDDQGTSTDRRGSDALLSRGSNLGLDVPPETRRAYSPVAETLFRKDLISAMKLPDNEPLNAEDFWTVTDTWKQEWERGVQVPVKPDGLPEPVISTTQGYTRSNERFAFPKKHLICMNSSGSYTAETHQVTPMAIRAEQVCTYDLDDVDQRWLAVVNGERALMGLCSITETEMERTVEELEHQCSSNINNSQRSSDDADVAQDDSIICDVCRSPDSEESNEMVFCDKCNICVHQACYGITSIPSGSWLCRTCTLGIKPPCELCPNKGGAMKSTRSGQKWAHVSCALWIPEVSIGCVEKMEPITKISSIPPSRWSLLCVLCKCRMGSCIQCSVKTCKTAYHVTCAFKHGLEMRAIIEDENAEDGVKLRSYCQKHSLNSNNSKTKKTLEDSDSESGEMKKNMTSDQKTLARRHKLWKVEREFYKLVDLAAAAQKVDLPQESVEFMFRYWTLKRRAGGNKPLLPPRGEEAALISRDKAEDTERDKMKMLVSIRQDLERVRNLAYMVNRREKFSRSFVKLREQILEKQLSLLADDSPDNQMSLMEMSAVIEANHGPTIYDKIYSHPDAEQHTPEDFEVIISRLSGEIKEGSSQIRRDNPFRKKSTDFPNDKPVPYERIFSDTSQSESDDSFIRDANPDHIRRGSADETRKRKGRKKDGVSATKKTSSVNNSKQKSEKISKQDGKSSSTSASKPVTRSDSSMSSTEEDEMMTMISPRKERAGGKKRKTANIYSDSDSVAKNTDSDGSVTRGRAPLRSSDVAKKKLQQSRKMTESSDGWRDSEQSMDRHRSPVFRTKAAMKDFSCETNVARGTKASDITPKAGRHSSKSPPNVKTSGGSKKSTKDVVEKPVVVTSASVSELDSDTESPHPLIIVPQRNAARRANEKLRVTDKKTDSDPQAGAAAETVASAEKVKKGQDGVTSSSSRVLIYSDSDNEQEALKQSRGSEYFFKGSVPNSSDEDGRPSPPKLKGKRKSKSPRGKMKQDTLGSDSEDQGVSDKISPRARQKALRSKKAGADSENESKDTSTRVSRKSPVKEAKKVNTDSESAEEPQKQTSKSRSRRKSSPTKLVKAVDTDSDSAGEIVKVPSPSRRKSSPFTQKKKTETHSDSKRKTSPVKQKNKADTDTDSNEDSDLPSKSHNKASNKRENSNSEAVEAPKKVKRKNELSALLESEGLPYVPQRQAAKKASEKLNEQEAWKKSQQEAYLNSIAVSAALAEKAKPNRGRPTKKASKESSPQTSGSDSDMDTSKRLDDSSDSSSSSSSSDSDDSVTPTKKSPRSSKSPKGAPKSPKRVQSPRTKRKQSPKKNTAPPKKANLRGKIHSSKALAYLSQREHQLDNIFEEFGIETDKSKKAPDKKLKTSEGRPDGFQSPPVHQKDTSDEKADEGSGTEEKADEESGAEQSLADLSIIGTISSAPKEATAPTRDSDSDHTLPPSGNDDSDADDRKAQQRRDGSRDRKPVVEEVGDRRTRTRSGDLNDSSLERRVPPRRSGRPSRDEGSSSRERRTRAISGTSPAQSQQLKQSPQTTSPRQKKSIFSPVRSPGPIVDSSGRIKLPTPVGAGKLESPRSKEEATAPPAWRPVSSRDRKLPESQSTPVPSKEKAGVGEIPTPAKSPTKSPALNRSFEANKSSPMQTGKDKTPLRESPQVKSPARSPIVKGSFESSRSSPMQNLRSPGFGRSSARHSQQPLNRSSEGIEPQHPLKVNECNDPTEASKLLDPKLAKSDDALKKSDVEPTDIPMDQDDERINRKLSVESKDSDGDSAKSSMPELNGLPDLNKEDSADTIGFGDKLLESVNKVKEPGAQQSKMDEGYVSAEKVQADLVQSLTAPPSDTNAQNQDSKKKEQPSQFLPQASPSSDKTLPPGKQPPGFELPEQSKPFMGLENSQREELDATQQQQSSNTSQPKPVSTSAWSDQLQQLQEQHQHHLLQQQQLQQQQLQQQQLDEQQRTAWQQHYGQQPTDPAKATNDPAQKPHEPVANLTDSLGKGRYDEKKGVDPLSASQQHAAAQFLSTQTEALFSSMFNVQARKGLQAADLNSQQMYAAQKYMQDLYGGKGYGTDFQNQMQNLDLLSQINYQNLLQYGGTHPAYMQQLQQYQQMSNKKPMSQEMAELQLLQSAYQQQAEMYAGGMYGKMGVDKTDLEKMALTRSGLSELERMARQEQSKEKGGNRAQAPHPAKTGQSKRDIEGMTNSHHERSGHRGMEQQLGASQMGPQRSQSQEGQQRSQSQDGQQRPHPDQMGHHRLQDPMAHYRSQQEQMGQQRQGRQDPFDHQKSQDHFMHEKAQLDHLALQQEQMAREKAAEQERLAREKAEQEKLARELAEQERLAKEKAEQERLAREKAEQERLAREKAEQERLAREKAEQERLAREKAEQERLAREKAEQERLAREKAEQERLAREKAEQERLAREKAEQERLAFEKAEQERLAREKAEQERLAFEKAEQERLAFEKAEQERLAFEKAEQERLAFEKAEQERLAHEKAEQERLAREKAEQERLAREKAEFEQLALQKAQQEQIARDKAQYEAFQKAQQDQMAHHKSQYEQMMHQKPQENHLSHMKAQQDYMANYGHMYGEQQMREHLTNQKAENHMTHPHQQMRDIYNREMNHQHQYYDPMNPNKRPGSPKSQNYQQHNQHFNKMQSHDQSNMQNLQQNHLQQKPHMEKMQSSQYFDPHLTNTPDNLHQNKSSQNKDRDSHRRPQQVSPKRPGSPKSEKPSCRLEQDQYGIPPVPSATPADKLPGFTPSLPHLRDRKHDTQDQQRDSHGNQRRDCHVEQRRGRDTPGSVAGSDGSHNSAPSGIPCELLDSVMEMAKLPVCKPPDNVKPPATSPAKPPVHSPPKPAPVSTERDSSFDDLVRHIDSSPSQKDPKPSSNTSVNYSSTRASKNELLKQSRSESKSSFKEPEKSQKLLELEKEVMKIKPIKPDADKDSKNKSEAAKPESESPPVKQGRETRSRKSDAKPDKKNESDQEASDVKNQDNFGMKGLSIDLGPNDLNLSFNIAGGLLSDVGNHSSMSERSAIGSDYDYDRDTMGGVDYDDIDDELPLATRRSVRGKASTREIPDISKWNKSKPEEAKDTKKKVPIYKQKPVDVSVDTDDGKETGKSIDESKVSLPDFSSPSSEADKSIDMPARKERKVPCYKTSTEATFDTSPTRVPFISDKAKRGKARGAGNSSVLRGKAGRGRGRVGGMFRSKGGPIYDEKAVEKVHRNLVGTDFDFENEFDDDVEYTPKERKDPGSLRDFRQQTKVEPIKPELTKKVPLYMRDAKQRDSIDTDDGVEIEVPQKKRDNAPEQNQIPPVHFDSEEEKADEEPENESLASRSMRSRRAKASRGKAARGRSGRGRARKEPDHVSDSDDEDDKNGADQDNIDTPEPFKGDEKEDDEKVAEQLNLPKIPKLKIKFGGTDSPNSVETGSPDNLDNLKKFRKKKDRRGSYDKKSQERKLSVEVEEEKEKPLWIPKLKIKIGGPKTDKAEVHKIIEAPKELPNENIPKDETAIPNEDQILEKVASDLDDDLEPPPLVIRTPVSSPPVTPLIIRAPTSSPTVTPLIIKAPVSSPTVTPLIIRAPTSSATVTPLIIKAPLSSPTVKPRQSSSRPMIDTEPTVVLEKLSTSELALQAMARSSPKSSSKTKPKIINIKTPEVNMASAAAAASAALANKGDIPSPKKPKGGIDFLANKLLARKQEEQPEDKEIENAEKQANDLASIFGPEVPLEGKVDAGDDDSNKESSLRNEPEGPSELELLALELGKELEMEKQKKQAQEDAKKDLDPFEKSESVEECIGQNLEEVVQEDEKGSHKMFKYKIKAPIVPDGPITITPSLLPVPAKHPTVNVISLTQMPPSAADSNPLRRMRKKELLNQYYGIEVQPVSTAVTNGPSAPPLVTTISAEPPVRNVIKMPKAVASVTSVPTRADYQSQLEANMERKRRREGKDPIDPRGKDKKGKKGKGKQPVEEEPYVPKSKISPDEFNSNDDLENKNEGNRRTRGKPPKKCLADSPERDPLDSVLEDSKSESMKYAEQILRDFDKGDHVKKDKEERRKQKKKRRRETEYDDEPVQPSTKTPRIVIKFSKDKSQSSKNITKENNGLTKPPPVILSKSREADATNPIPKLKLKVGGKV